MITAAGRASTRVLGGATAAIGGALVLRPTLARRASTGPATPNPTIVRVLGGRQLAQGCLQVLIPAADVVAAGIVVDLIHAASMLAASLIWPAYRRPALTSMAIATATAATATALLAVDRR